MSALQKPEPAQVLMKSFNNACSNLGISNAAKSKMLGINASTLSRNQLKGFAPESKEGELQLHFIRLYRSLYAIAGGSNEFMEHWFTTYNSALNGVPSELCLKIMGMFQVNEYLDAMRGKI